MDRCMPKTRYADSAPFGRIGTVNPENDTLRNYQTLRNTLRRVLPNFAGCLLVGGAVRDLLVGRAPRDLDVILSLSEGVECEYKEAFESLDKVAQEFAREGWKAEVLAAYEQGPDDVVKDTHFNRSYSGLLKLTSPSADVVADLLVVRRYYPLVNTVRTFDSNLTRVFMKPNGDCYGLAGEHPSFGLVIDADCREGRIQKHVAFWRRYYHDSMY